MAPSPSHFTNDGQLVGQSVRFADKLLLGLITRLQSVVRLFTGLFVMGVLSDEKTGPSVTICLVAVSCHYL
jgi:hypothetical protein